MAMVINPPTSSGGANTLYAYKDAAQGVQAASSPATGVSGGQVVPNEEGGSNAGAGESSSGSSGMMTASRIASGSKAMTSATGTMAGSSSSGSSSSRTGSATGAAASASVSGAAVGLLRPFAAGLVIAGCAVVAVGLD